MSIDVINVGENKLYYYTKDEWQKPVITEYQIFKSIKESNFLPMNYFAFPWATLIDEKFKNNANAKLLLDNYTVENKDCFTIMQHINFRNKIHVVKKIGIRYIFTSHKQPHDVELEKKHNIKIIAISLYPAQFNKSLIIPLNKRQYLTSFIGQHEQYYLTEIRVKIFSIFSNYKDCFIKRRNGWHYGGMVYGNKLETNKEYEKEYSDILSKSKFSLCPSGSGPNSIRIWESMSYGSVPVILADTLILPEIKNINWEDYFILCKEKDINFLYDYLSNVTPERLEKLSNNCIDLYNTYFAPEKMYLQVIEYLEKM